MSIAKPSERPTVVVIGAGDRGANAYVPLLLDQPELGRIVAVAERNPERRQEFADRFRLAVCARFAEAHALLEKPRMANIGRPSWRF